ncbi:MAG: lysophospholipid acyltransferase family protein [Acidobacteriota bacterium]
MRAVRLALVALATARDYFTVLLGSWWLRRRPRRRVAFQHRVMRRWGTSLCRHLRVRWTVRGSVPEPPFLLVSNHLSYADIVVLAGLAGGSFVAKADLGDWPFLGPMCRASDTLLIDRNTKRDLLRVGAMVEERMAAGGGVILFAEGTTGDGSALLPFKPSLLEVAARTGRPVHWATLSYRTGADDLSPRDGVCWFGEEEFMPHFRRFSRLREIEAVITFGAEPLAGSDRKELAARLRQAMGEVYEPTG